MMELIPGPGVAGPLLQLWLLDKHTVCGGCCCTPGSGPPPSCMTSVCPPAVKPRHSCRNACTRLHGGHTGLAGRPESSALAGCCDRAWAAGDGRATHRRPKRQKTSQLGPGVPGQGVGRARCLQRLWAQSFLLPAAAGAPGARAARLPSLPPSSWGFPLAKTLSVHEGAPQARTVPCGGP